jgi:predicted nuclease of restriction endonuclease-like (RecB) superfamily
MAIKKSPHKRDALFSTIKSLLQGARSNVIRQTNSTIVLTYFEIGRLIIESEQGGKIRAEYAKQVLENLSAKLTAEFGKGFSIRNLEQMRKFYSLFCHKIPQTVSAESLKRRTGKRIRIPQTVSAEFKSGVSYADLFPLSWSHYVFLCRISNKDERSFYEIETTQNHWSLTELERQFNASLYERLVLSRNKKKVKELALKGQIVERPEDAIKQPFVLEFLGLKEETFYSESDLESAIINQVEHFMLEMGKGFLFAGRQVRFTFDEENFFVDLVFYNRLLRCFVLIDLKLGKLKHQDLGQMQMYVNYYDRFIKTETENNTIGVIICKDKKDAIVEITLPKNQKQVFASQYQLYLPSKQQFKKMILGK